MDGKSGGPGSGSGERDGDLAGEGGLRSQVVVAVALVDERRRLLACRRVEPPAVAGFWEFPGGKVEPGEAGEVAAVRECREELGVDVQLGPLLGEVELSRSGWMLRVWYGRVLTGTPQAVDHDELRWLEADALNDVPWLPADVPLVDEARRRLGDPSPIFPDFDRVR